MTNIQDIFTLLLETEDKYPPKCKIRCRNAESWSLWMNTTLSLKEKKRQNPILSSDQFCSFYTVMRITNAVLDTVMYFWHVICLNVFFCMYSCVSHVRLIPRGSVKSPKTWLTDDYELPGRCWKSNCGPVQEHHILLTAESSLQIQLQEFLRSIFF